MNKKYYLGIAAVALLITSIGVTAIANASELKSTSQQRFMQADRAEHQNEMKGIMENGDYSAWQTLMQTRATSMEERLNELKANINEETFANMQKIHELRASGDLEGAKALAEELNLPMGGQKMMGRSMHKGGFEKQSNNEE